MGWSGRRESTSREVALRIEAVEFRCADQAIENGGAFAALIRTGEEVILASESDGTQSPFGGVVVNFQATIFRVTRQRFPASQRILHGCRRVRFCDSLVKQPSSHSCNDSSRGRARVCRISRRSSGEQPRISFQSRTEPRSAPELPGQSVTYEQPEDRRISCARAPNRRPHDAPGFIHLVEPRVAIGLQACPRRGASDLGDAHPCDPGSTRTTPPGGWRPPSAGRHEHRSRAVRSWFSPTPVPVPAPECRRRATSPHLGDAYCNGPNRM